MQSLTNKYILFNKYIMLVKKTLQTKIKIFIKFGLRNLIIFKSVLRLSFERCKLQQNFKI